MKNTVRISLNAKTFPFLYRDAHRSALLLGADSNVRYAGYYGTDESADWGVPQLIYCENVMPIAKGLISTQITELINPLSPSATNFDQAITLRDEEENNTLIVPADGQNYILDPLTGTWATSHPFSFTGKLVTRAYVQGRTFICYEKEKLFEYDGATGTLIDRTASLVFPSGTNFSDIRGIGGASNYLMLFTDIAVFWSSPTDVLNFDIDAENGSGRQIPQDARGRISCILPVSGGAIIYTVRNAIACTFTNNAATPFAFRGISNSGGVADYEQVAYDADELYQYVWGSGGLQRVSLQRAEAAFAEVTDFLTSSLYEYYDYDNHVVVSQQLGSYLAVKLTYVSQRFLVISYGPAPGAYTYALIYDTALDRWGKVRYDHVDAITYPYPNITGDLTIAQLSVDFTGLGDQSIADLGVGILTVAPPKKSIGFLQKNGTVAVLAIDYRLRSQTGVALVGQIQHNRQRFTTLHEVELEGLDASAVAPKLYVMMSLNGKTISSIRQYQAYEMEDGYQKFLGEACAKNVTLGINGAFQLTNLLCQVSVHGRA